MSTFTIMQASRLKVASALLEVRGLIAGQTAAICLSTEARDKLYIALANTNEVLAALIPNESLDKDTAE
jgi:hypothetical protein